MAEFIGWIVVVSFGAYVVFGVTAAIVYAAVMGGLEAVVPAVLTGAIVASAWVGFALWLSPLTIGWAP